MSHYLANTITRWVLFIQKHGRLALAIILLATLVAAVWAAKLFALNTDTQHLIKPSAESRWYQQNKEFEEAFPQFQNTAIVVISGAAPQDVNNTTDALLRAFRQSDWFHSVAAPGREPFFTEHLLYELEVGELADLSTQLQSLLPLLTRLDEDTSLAAFFTLAQQSLMRDSMTGEVSQRSRMLLQKLLEALSTSDQINWLEDKKAASRGNIYQVIVLQGRQQFSESTPAKAVLEAIRDIIANHQPPGANTRVRVTGELAMADEELRTALQGIQFAGAASLALLALLLTFGVRSWTVVLAIFALLIAGVVWTCLYASLTVGSFNTLSLVFLVMFFGLGVDFALHFSLRVQESLSSPREREQPLGSATQDIGTALLLCTLTSGMAFLSFLPTQYRGLAELGIISAGGMLIAFLLTITLLPAWFAVIGMPGPWHGSGSKKLHFGMDQFAPSTVLLLTVVVSAAAAWFAKDVRFDYSVLAMRDKTSEAMDTLLEMQREEISTDYSVSVLVPPGDVDALVPRLLALPSVAQIETPHTRIAADQVQKRALLAPLQAYGDLQLLMPDSFDDVSASAAQVLLISQLEQLPGSAGGEDLDLLARVRDALLTLRDSGGREKLERNLVAPLVDGVRALRVQLLAEPYGLEDLPPLARARLIAPDGRHLLEVLPQEQLNDLEVVDRFVAEVEQVAPNIAGRTVAERGFGQAVVNSFRLAVALALAGIFLVLLMYFRELLTPMLVLIPLGLTTLFTFAVIQLSGLTLNMANILVVPLIFGLGVDTGIHVVHRYHSAGDISDLLQSSTPRAVTLSALTTIGTFISISFSPHQGAASIGLILSVAIALLMVVTFVVLPALLAQFEPRSPAKPASKKR